MSDKTYPQNKVKAIQEFAEKAKNAKSIFLADFSGLNVEKMTALRDKFHEKGAEILIVKNTLAKIALRNVGIQGLDSFLIGPNAFAFGMDDPSVPAGILFEFAKEHEKPQVKSCLFEGKVYGPDKIKIIKDLPSKEQILAELIGQIQAPLSSFIGVLQEILRSFVGVIDAIVQQKDTAPESQ